MASEQRPEIGSENWLREQLAKGLGTDEADRPSTEGLRPGPFAPKMRP